MSSSSNITFAQYFRKLQSHTYEDYLKLLHTEIVQLYEHAKVTEVPTSDDPPPSKEQLDQWEQEFQHTYKIKTADLMTDNLSRFALLLQSFWRQSYSEADMIKEEVTEVLTRELKEAAENTFRNTESKFSPCFVAVHRYVNSLQDCEEKSRFWQWSGGERVPQLTHLEVIVFIQFALSVLGTHYTAIKEFLMTGGNASYKRRKGDDDEEETSDAKKSAHSG